MSPLVRTPSVEPAARVAARRETSHEREQDVGACTDRDRADAINRQCLRHNDVPPCTRFLLTPPREHCLSGKVPELTLVWVARGCSRCTRSASEAIGTDGMNSRVDTEHRPPSASPQPAQPINSNRKVPTVSDGIASVSRDTGGVMARASCGAWRDSHRVRGAPPTDHVRRTGDRDRRGLATLVPHLGTGRGVSCRLPLAPEASVAAACAPRVLRHSRKDSEHRAATKGTGGESRAAHDRCLWGAPGGNRSCPLTPERLAPSPRVDTPARCGAPNTVEAPPPPVGCCFRLRAPGSHVGGPANVRLTPLDGAVGGL
jgi:hypothetical protein